MKIFKIIIIELRKSNVIPAKAGIHRNPVWMPAGVYPFGYPLSRV